MHRTLVFLTGFLAAGLTFLADAAAPKGNSTEPAGEDPSSWVCNGKKLSDPKPFKSVFEECAKRVNYCRDMCVLIQMGVLSGQLTFQEAGVKNIFDKLKVPLTVSQPFIKTVKVCTAKLDSKDKTDDCKGNKSYLECFKKVVAKTCNSSESKFGFTEGKTSRYYYGGWGGYGYPMMPVYAGYPPQNPPSLWSILFG